MKYLIEFFLKRKVLVNVIIIGVVLGGIRAVINLPKDGFPAV